MPWAIAKSLTLSTGESNANRGIRRDAPVIGPLRTRNLSRRRDNRQAIDTYDGGFASADNPGTLNLAWTIDERDHLALDLGALLRAELTRESDDLALTYTYGVTDPYGDAVVRPAIADLFGVSEEAIRVATGAGVTSLLAVLARSERGAVHVLGTVYPDFPFWIEATDGCSIVAIPDDPADDPAALQDAGFVFLERPNLFSTAYDDLGRLGELCQRVERGVVVVDESNANYAPPTYSAVRLVQEHANLVVLRGLSKAFGLGGLRCAALVCAPSRWAWACARVPPLLVSSVSLNLAARIFAAGDATVTLRARIAEGKAITLGAFDSAGIRDTLLPNPWFPYVLIADAQGHSRRLLDRHGIRGKHHIAWPSVPAQPGTDTVYRLSVPLNADRLTRLKTTLGTAGSAS